MVDRPEISSGDHAFRIMAKDHGVAAVGG